MTAVESPSDAFRGSQPVATSFYSLGGDASLIQEIHFQWGTLLAATITIWSCSFRNVPLTSVVAGEWVQQNPPTGYTAITPPAAATAATPLVLTIPGGTAGGASMGIGNIGCKQLRVQVVCTVSDFLRICGNGKY